MNKTGAQRKRRRQQFFMKPISNRMDSLVHLGSSWDNSPFSLCQEMFPLPSAFYAPTFLNTCSAIDVRVDEGHGGQPMTRGTENPEGC